jgi:hypothetical protein
MNNIIICIGNKEMSLMDAYNYCSKTLLCSEPDDSENLQFKEFATPKDFLKQLQKDAATTMNTSETEGGESVYLKDLLSRS